MVTAIASQQTGQPFNQRQNHKIKSEKYKELLKQKKEQLNKLYGRDEQKSKVNKASTNIKKFPKQQLADRKERRTQKIRDLKGDKKRLDNPLQNPHQKLLHSLKKTDVSVPAPFLQSSTAPRVLVPDFKVHPETFDTGSVDDQWMGSVAKRRDGEFITAWVDYRNSEPWEGIYAQRFTRLGEPIGNNFKVSSDDVWFSDELAPSIACTPRGDFVIVWHADYIYAQLYNSDGTPKGENFMVNSEENWPEYIPPSVAMDTTGVFVVTWYGYTEFAEGVFARWFKADGEPLSDEICVNADTPPGDVPSGVNNPFNEEWPTTNYRFTPNSPPSPSNYTIDTFPLGLTPITGGTVLESLTDADDAYEIIEIPFPFRFYGEEYSDNLAVTTNGLLVFGDQDNIETYNNQYIPSAYPPNNFIAPFWDDLVVPSTARVRYRTTGSEPNRVVTIQWRNVQQYNGPTSRLTFQIKLYETSNIIELLYSTTDNVFDYTPSYTLGLEGQGSGRSIYTYPSQPSVAIDYNGKSVIAFTGYDEEDNYAVFARSYAPLGAPDGEIFKVNRELYYPEAELGALSAKDSAGNFAIAWWGYDDEEGYNGIYFQRYDKNRIAVGPTVAVNNGETWAEYLRPSLAMEPSGSFVIGFLGGGPDDDGFLGMKYSSDGNPVSPVLYFNLPNEDYTYPEYWSPAVGIDISKEIVGAWTGYGNFSLDIFGRCFGDDGTALCEPFMINDDLDIIGANQLISSIGADTSGNFIVVWLENRLMSNGIYFQRYNKNGTPLGISTKVSDIGEYFYYYTAIDIAVAPDGRFVIAWSDYSGYVHNVFAQRYNSDGTPIGNIFQVNTTSAEGVWQTSIAIADNGNFVITWHTWNSTYYYDIYAKLFDFNGNPLTSEILVNDDALSSIDQWKPAVAMVSNGQFIIVWSDDRNYNTYGSDIYGQRFSASGLKLGSNFRINNDITNSSQDNPTIGADKNGNFVVTWMDYRNGVPDIYHQRFDINGTRLSLEDIKVNDLPLYSYSGKPSISVDRDGSYIIVWDDIFNIIGQQYDIMAKRFRNNFFISSTQPPSLKWSPDVAIAAGRIYTTWTDRLRTPKTNLDVWANVIKEEGPVYIKYFSLTQDSLNKKAVKLKPKKFPGETIKRIPMPNAGNIRDSVYGKVFTPRGGLTIGIPRPDSATSYGWVRWKKGSNAQKAFPHTGSARGFTTLGNRPFVKEQKNLKVSKHDNRLLGEQHALKINIAASDIGITPRGFGDLVFADTSDTANPCYGKTIRQIARLVDTSLTYWKRYPSTHFTKLCNCLNKINIAFADPIDTVSTKPLVIKGKRYLADVPYLLPSTEETMLSIIDIAYYGGELPDEFKLEQNYPNPFNPSTTIKFSIPVPSLVTLNVYNILGQEVVRLLDREHIVDGEHEIEFNASGLASGVYFYRIAVEGFEEDGEDVTYNSIRKMILIK